MSHNFCLVLLLAFLHCAFASVPLRGLAASDTPGARRLLDDDDDNDNDDDSSVGARRLRLNEIFIKGVHNAYHAPSAAAGAPAGADPSTIYLWDYSHPAPSTIYESGARLFELDIQDVTAEDATVYHVGIFDTATNTGTTSFKDILTRFESQRRFSIFLLERKRSLTAEQQGWLKDHILAVFGSGRVLTPAHVTAPAGGQAPTKADPLVWPTVKEVEKDFGAMFLTQGAAFSDVDFSLDGPFVKAVPPGDVLSGTSARELVEAGHLVSLYLNAGPYHPHFTRPGNAPANADIISRYFWVFDHNNDQRLGFEEGLTGFQLGAELGAGGAVPREQVQFLYCAFACADSWREACVPCLQRAGPCDAGETCALSFPEFEALVAGVPDVRALIPTARQFADAAAVLPRLAGAAKRQGVQLLRSDWVAPYVTEGFVLSLGGDSAEEPFEANAVAFGCETGLLYHDSGRGVARGRYACCVAPRAVVDGRCCEGADDCD